MPRVPRHCPSGYPVHVIQRGHNRQILFTSNKDIAAYVHWLQEGAIKFEVDVHGWVFMSNHVHFLFTPKHSDSISKLMQYLGRLYVRKINHAHARSGTLFEGRFKSCLVQEDSYFLTCLRYIELNPVRAGIVTDPGEYHWSSYRTHAFGAGAKLWTPHILYLGLGKNLAERQKNYRGLMNGVLDGQVIAKIRHCTNTGLVLGSEKFREQVKKLIA